MQKFDALTEVVADQSAMLSNLTTRLEVQAEQMGTLISLLQAQQLLQQQASLSQQASGSGAASNATIMQRIGALVSRPPADEAGPATEESQSLG